MKAGTERNLGHDYMEGLDERMSETARETVPTGWEVIDDLIPLGGIRIEDNIVVKDDSPINLTRKYLK